MNWDCAICGVDTLNEYYMVHDSIWKQFGCEPLLCIGCLEARLGRELRCVDFTPAMVNRLDFSTKSARLRERLTRITYG